MSGFFIWLTLFLCGVSCPLTGETKMTDTITSEVEYVVLSMHEESTDHITADFMCEHARATHLKLFNSATLELCPFPTKPGLYVVPVRDQDETVTLKLLEVGESNSNLRDTDVVSSAGWSVKCRWLFMR
jgi:hypothetical protein